MTAASTAADRHMTTAPVRARIRAALLALPADERASHCDAVAAMIHLVSEHCPEGREPRVFVAGTRAYAAAAWAATLLGHTVVPCVPDCAVPTHLTMVLGPITPTPEAQP
jgi:hypothetical protein